MRRAQFSVALPAVFSRPLTPDSEDASQNRAERRHFRQIRIKPAMRPRYLLSRPPGATAVGSSATSVTATDRQPVCDVISVRDDRVSHPIALQFLSDKTRRPVLIAANHHEIVGDESRDVVIVLGMLASSHDDSLLTHFQQGKLGAFYVDVSASQN